MSNAPSLAQVLETAVRHHQGGNVAEAERLYRSVLDQDPNQTDALNLLGFIVQQAGDLDQALGLFDRAMAAAPDLATIPFNKGNALRDGGHQDEARDAYEAALTIDPKYEDALLNLGVLLHEGGDTAAAMGRFNALLALDPDNAQAHYNLGKCRQSQGRLDEAEDALAKATTLDPDFPDAHFAQANVLAALGKLNAAIRHINTATKLKPNWAEAISSSGLILGRAGQFDKAIEFCKAAIELESSKGAYYFNLGWVHQKARQNDLAESAFIAAIEQGDVDQGAYMGLASNAMDSMDPWASLKFLERALHQSPSAPVLNNIASIFQNLDLNALAKPFFKAALDVDPNLEKVSLEMGHLDIRMGNLQEGWINASKRLENIDFLHLKGGSPPFWKGESLKSKTIFIFFDEGIGDQIVCASMLPDIIDQSGHCILECSKRLVPVFQRSFPTATVIDWRERERASTLRSHSDFQYPAVDLGRYVRGKFEDFPVQNSFLMADPEMMAAYRDKYKREAQGKRIVGLAWLSGSADYGSFKTIDLKSILSRFETDSLSLISLQYGNVQEQLDEAANELGVHVTVDDNVSQIESLEEFFAQVSAMDLVVTISNTTAHVSGSLGVPTLLMLPRGAGVLYYWFSSGTESPWYPSVRIFRQQTAPDFDKPWWPEVIGTVAGALEDWLTEPLPPRIEP